jgi:hypothetical protein
LKVERNDAQEEDPSRLQINETEGEHTVQGQNSSSTTLDYAWPLKTNKYNIGIEEVPKMAIIGD